jgi:hypothetical protein
MSKAVIRIGYNDYVMEIEQALLVAQALTAAQRYRSKGWGNDTSYYIWDDPAKEVELKVLSDEVVRIATMAGAPPKE